MNDNVLRNEDIQINLHFLLMHKVLDTQKENINKLIKEGLLTLLHSEDIFKLA